MVFAEENFFRGIDFSLDCGWGGLKDCAGLVLAVSAFPENPVTPSGLNVTVTPEKSFTQSYSIPNSHLTFSVRNFFSGSTLLATVRNILPASIYCRVSARRELDWQIQNDCGSVVFSVNAAFRKTEKIIPRSEPRYPHLRNNYCQSQLAAGRKEFLRL